MRFCRVHERGVVEAEGCNQYESVCVKCVGMHGNYRYRYERSRVLRWLCYRSVGRSSAKVSMSLMGTVVRWRSTEGATPKIRCRWSWSRWNPCGCCGQLRQGTPLRVTHAMSERMPCHWSLVYW